MRYALEPRCGGGVSVEDGGLVVRLDVTTGAHLVALHLSPAEADAVADYLRRAAAEQRRRRG